MRFWRLAIILLLIPGRSLADDSRMVVPITQVVLPDGAIRYSVPVRLGDAAPVDAIIDSGSTGLRVMRDAVPADSFTDTGLGSSYAYGSGDRLSGSIATAQIGIGGAETDVPVPIEIVNAVGCMDFAPGCGASKLSLQDYGIGGDGIAGQGFRAILGIGLMPADNAGYTENPLDHIGTKRWIIELPEPGESGPGALILNPDDRDLQGYSRFQLKAVQGAGLAQDAGWNDALPGCLNDNFTDQTLCGPTILDTGSPLILAFQKDAELSGLWSPGDQVTLSFATGGSGSLDVSFLADRFAGTALGQTAPTGLYAINAGILPFFSYTVLYDGESGVIGLKPRVDAPDMINTPQNGGNANLQMEVIQMNAPAASPPPAGGPMVLPQVITPSQ